ncbi:fusion protein [avian paramyxovirus 20]|uniref:Fusion glycoprotein F0 n=1 Tax=avian paramyxovirus 20 TaxID=2560314 RepID=A0A2I6ECF5_9MONO|nr:fusion protein [Avian metaavulavirus 20]AUJ87606.2 fusion protein [Avian metaavulavirus 20]
MMDSLRLTILLVAWFSLGECLDNANTGPIGVLKSKEWQLAAYTQSLYGTIAVRFIPILPSNLTSCMLSVIQDYNQTVSSLLGPIGNNLDSIISSSGEQQARLIGAIVGTVALGVATSAQITAALAVNQAQDNARQIWKLKEAILKTNDAVLELKEGLSQTAVALDKVQSFINNEILPQISSISCEVAANKLGVFLSLYLTELTTVFGNQITNPALTPLSYQALYNLCGGNLAALTRQMGIKDDTLTSLYEAGLIVGQIIGYDASSQILLIQVSYPSVSEITGVRATELVTVSVATIKGEGRAIVPQFVAEGHVTIEELDTSPCRFSKSTLFCRSILTRPLPIRVANCLSGKYDDCQYTTEIGLLSSRYVTVDGGVMANCKSTVCKCLNPEKIILQKTASAITAIDKNTCKLLQINDVKLRLEGTLHSQYFRNISIASNQITSSGSLDISSEIGAINNTVNKVEDLINQSNGWLDSVNPKLMSNTTIIILCVLSGLAIVWLLILTIIMCYSAYKLKSLSIIAAMNSATKNPYVSNTKF